MFDSYAQNSGYIYPMESSMTPESNNLFLIPAGVSGGFLGGMNYMLGNYGGDNKFDKLADFIYGD